MGYNGKRIAEWERAIEHRSDIEFEQMNLKNGQVQSVIGTIKQHCKRKYKGQTHFRTRRVRWNRFGECSSIYPNSTDRFEGYNIFN